MLRGNVDVGMKGVMDVMGTVVMRVVTGMTERWLGALRRTRDVTTARGSATSQHGNVRRRDSVREADSRKETKGKGKGGKPFVAQKGTKAKGKDGGGKGVWRWIREVGWWKEWR